MYLYTYFTYIHTLYHHLHHYIHTLYHHLHHFYINVLIYILYICRSFARATYIKQTLLYPAHIVFHVQLKNFLPIRRLSIATNQPYKVLE